MRQRASNTLAANGYDVDGEECLRLVFGCRLGWCGIEMASEVMRQTWIGHANRDALCAAMGPAADESGDLPSSVERVRDRFRDYAEGAADDFRDVPIDTTWCTPFQRAVISAVRGIGYGETGSYGDVARRAGRPGAARAVGSVMASNRLPIIVPCHRVIASGGGIGGFSAPTGVTLKQRLLRLEGH